MTTGSHLDDPQRIATRLTAVRLHSGLGKWSISAHGLDGWQFISPSRFTSVIVSCADFGDSEIVHASIARNGTCKADYDDLVKLHRAIWGDTGYAYQQFVPAAHHVNIHPGALHLWGRLDGRPIPGLPVLTEGTI